MVNGIYLSPQEGARPAKDGALHCLLLIYNPVITLKHSLRQMYYKHHNDKEAWLYLCKNLSRLGREN